MPLPVEPPYTIAVAAELLGYSVGYVKRLLCLHRALFPVRTYRRGRRLHALRVRVLTAQEIRLLQTLRSPTRPWKARR
jgi:hypothetical protein